MLKSGWYFARPLIAVMVALLIILTGCSTSKLVVIDRNETLLGNEDGQPLDIQRIYFKNGVSAPVSNCKIENGGLICYAAPGSPQEVEVVAEIIDSVRTSNKVYKNVWTESIAKLSSVLAHDLTYERVKFLGIHNDSLSFLARCRATNSSDDKDSIDVWMPKSLPWQSVDSIRVSVKEISREKTIGFVAFCTSFAVGFLVYWVAHTSGGFD